MHNLLARGTAISCVISHTCIYTRAVVAHVPYLTKVSESVLLCQLIRCNSSSSYFHCPHVGGFWLALLGTCGGRCEKQNANHYTQHEAVLHGEAVQFSNSATHHMLIISQLSASLRIYTPGKYVSIRAPAFLYITSTTSGMRNCNLSITT